MTKPTIVLVPGLWEGPRVYAAVISQLQSRGYETPTAALLSTGQVSPDNGTLQDDVRAIRKEIEPLVEEGGKEIILVLHSAAGFLGSNAIEGLVLEKRKKEGKRGGVRKIVFLSAGIMPEGVMHPELPFFENVGGRMYCRNARTSLFNDFSDSEAEELLKDLQCQPSTGWHDVVTYAGWKDVPSIYLIAENDAVVPPEMQRQMAEMAGSEIETCKVGHMMMLKQPEKVVELVLKAAGD